jgi:hypothetical protein
MHIVTPVSPGELIDKITILEIKTVEITDELKLQNVKKELNLLLETVKILPETAELHTLWNELRQINKLIWDSENHVREFWNDDIEFLRAARESHHNNDERALMKRRINELCGSSIIEEKSHPKYEHKG